MSDTRPAAKEHRSQTGHRLALLSAAASSCAECDWSDPDHKETVEVATDARLPWLHGWPRIGTTSVLMGTWVRCVGCGADHGVTCVAFEEDWEPPGPDPDWPFPEDACPACSLRTELSKDPKPEPWPRGKPRPLP